MSSSNGSRKVVKDVPRERWWTLVDLVDLVLLALAGGAERMLME